MPFDSQGNFTRLHSWEQDRIDDIDIVTDHHVVDFHIILET